MLLPNAEIERIKCAMSYHEYKMGKARDEGQPDTYMYHAKAATKYVARIAEVMKGIDKKRIYIESSS